MHQWISCGLIVANNEFCEDRWNIEEECSDLLDTVDTGIRLFLPPPIRPHICFISRQVVCESNNAMFAGYHSGMFLYPDSLFTWDYYLLMISWWTISLSDLLPSCS